MNLVCGVCPNYEYCKSKEKPMTNEEWIKSANTEQLAEWICEIVLGYHELGVDLNRFADKSVNKQIAVEWLKQPHKPIS